jgi:hypothetical protein
MMEIAPSFDENVNEESLGCTQTFTVWEVRRELNG